ncbi:hypothetical protein BST61_g9057 [Cercospora zeina]
MAHFSHRIRYLAIASLAFYIAADAQTTTAPTCPFANTSDQTFNSARGGAWTARCGNPIDIDGDDVGIGTQTSDGYAGCIDLCDSTTNCNGVAFVPFGNNPNQASGTGQGTCYLKAITPGTSMPFRETGGSRVAAIRNYQSSAPTTSSSVSRASSPAATAGAYPPPGDSTLGAQQNFTNSNGQSYAVTGGCDTTGASVPGLANGESLTGWSGCMSQCDAYPACAGFTWQSGYQATNGTDFGRCFYKSGSPITTTSCGSDQRNVAAIKIASPPAPSGPTSSSGVAPTNPSSAAPVSTSSSLALQSPTTSTRAPSTPAQGAYGSPTACPSPLTANNHDQNVTASGSSWAVRCGSDIYAANVPTNANREAPNGYSDCFGFCASTAGCDGFTFSGPASGQGAGTCYLKQAYSGQAIVFFNTATVGAFRIQSPPYVSPTGSSSGGPSPAVSTTSTASTVRLVPGSLLVSGHISLTPATSFASTTTTLTPSSAFTSPPLSQSSSIAAPACTGGYYGAASGLCPADNAKTITDVTGTQYYVGCNRNIPGQSIYPNNQEASSYASCLSFCSNGTFTTSPNGQGAIAPCYGFTFFQGFCYFQTFDGPQTLLAQADTIAIIRPAYLAGYVAPAAQCSQTTATSSPSSPSQSSSSTSQNLAASSTTIVISSSISSFGGPPNATPTSTLVPESSTSSSIGTSSSILTVTPSTTVSSLAASLTSTAAATATVCPGIYGTVSGCPADNNKTVTDAAGIQYYIGCGQDTRGQIKNPSLVATDLSACFDRCSSNTGFTDGASGPCHGFTVFQGYCYFQTFDGPQNLIATSGVNAYLRTNYLAGYVAPGADCTQSASSSSLASSGQIQSSATSTLVPTSPSSTSVQAGSTLSVPEISTASGTSQASSASSSSSSAYVTPGTATQTTSSSVNTRQAVATATGRPQFSCPANNQQIMQDNCGVSYIIGCNNETVAGSSYPAIEAATFNDCFSQCSSGSVGVCISWTWFQGFCYLKAPSYGNDRFNGFTQGVVAGINIDYYNTPDRPLPSSTTRACASGVPVFSSTTSRTTSTGSRSAASSSIASTLATTRPTTVRSSSVVPTLSSATASTSPATGLSSSQTILSTSIFSSAAQSASLTGSTVLDSTASAGTSTASIISSNVVESTTSITVASTTPPPSSSTSPILTTQSSLASVDQSSTLATSSALSQSSQYPDISNSPSVTLTEPDTTPSSSSTAPAEYTPPPACPTGSADEACVQIARNSTCVSNAGNTYNFTCGYAFTGTAIPDDDVVLPPPYDTQPYVPPTETPVARRRSLDSEPSERTFIFPKRVPLPNIETCQQACDNTPRCQGVNFISYNCTLLSEITGTTPYPGAVVAQQVSDSGPPPGSTVATYSQTYVPTSTSGAIPSAVPSMSTTMTSGAPAATGLSCSADDGRIYTGISGSYYVECNMEIGGLLLYNDMANKHKRQAVTPETCMVGCQIYGDTCVGVNYRPGSCTYYGSLNTLSPSEGTLALVKVEAVAGPPTGYPTASSPATTASTSAALSSANTGQSSLLTSDNGGVPSGYPGGSSASSISQIISTTSTRIPSTGAQTSPSNAAPPSSPASVATNSIGTETPNSHSTGGPSASSLLPGTSVTTGASGGVTSSLSGSPNVSSAPTNPASSSTTTGSPNSASSSTLPSAGTPGPSTVTVCKNVRTRTTVVVTTTTLTTCRAEQACGTARR